MPLHADMEKQHRVLVRWEQHVAEQRAGSGADGSASSPALRALKVGQPISTPLNAAMYAVCLLTLCCR